MEKPLSDSNDQKTKTAQKLFKDTNQSHQQKQPLSFQKLTGEDCFNEFLYPLSCWLKNILITINSYCAKKIRSLDVKLKYHTAVHFGEKEEQNGKNVNPDAAGMLRKSLASVAPASSILYVSYTMEKWCSLICSTRVHHYVNLICIVYFKSMSNCIISYKLFSSIIIL